MDLRLRTRALEGATVVEVSGEIDLHSAPQLKAELMKAGEATTSSGATSGGSAPQVVVDLSGVTFIDSTGIGVLVGALKRVREAEGTLVFCGAQSRVRRVFEITGLLRALPLFETRTAAQESLLPQSGGGKIEHRDV